MSLKHKFSDAGIQDASTIRVKFEEMTDDDDNDDEDESDEIVDTRA